ncbi:hypothetical protein JR316_0008674 [Psilocybe cubensis]|uniref:Uncharacterized protein n=2 Tax=Psilocybe cubensis TaxID=181762 RepID=A0ACB8GRC8_PSICU|nr:hypothetical protein JR316_0008674 [Psilocybe cubensis]KAH9478221.1 hypothetical protein JR316_0008674 [Psilocybe cubensis]
MAPSPISKLSQELIDRIIDALVEPSEVNLASLNSSPSHNSALFSSSLICRSFRARSQKLLYSHVTIDVHRVDSFYRLIMDSGIIAGYVEDLELLLTHNDYKWLWEDQRFMRIMNALALPRSALRTLSLRTRHVIQNIEDGRAMVQKFIKPFIGPKITSLQIYGLSSIPVEVVSSCVNLTHLVLSWTGVDTSFLASPEVEILSRPVKLRRLTYNHSPNALTMLLGWNGTRPCLDISQLTILTIGIEAFNNLSFEQRIIDATGNTLRELHITDLECHEINYTADRFVNLRGCSHLRVLELDVNFGRSVLLEDDMDDLDNICRILSNIPNPNQLHDFRFTVHVGYWVNQEPEAILEADWDRFSEQIRRCLARKSVLSLHMDYLPSDDSMAEGNTSDHEDRRSTSYKVRCAEAMGKLVREKFSGFSTAEALISILTTYSISSFYS